MELEMKISDSWQGTVAFLHLKLTLDTVWVSVSDSQLMDEREQQEWAASELCSVCPSSVYRKYIVEFPQDRKEAILLLVIFVYSQPCAQFTHQAVLVSLQNPGPWIFLWATLGSLLAVPSRAVFFFFREFLAQPHVLFYKWHNCAD